jgi:hypothetical protein
MPARPAIETAFVAVECVIDRVDQRLDLSREIVAWQPDGRCIRPDSGRHARDVPNWL